MDYGDPNHEMPAGLFEFGRTFFPNMRFGLATTLMNDGFFFQNSGGEGPAENWWYDEYDFNIGDPVAPAAQLGMAPGNLILTRRSRNQTGPVMMREWVLSY
jgi:hypothetical protein